METSRLATVAMDLKKLPPSMLVALGLGGTGCGVNLDACLSPPIEETESVGTTSDGNTNTVGPCLSPPLDTGLETTSVGPCLGADPMTETGTGTGGSTDTGTGTDGTTDGGTGIDGTTDTGTGTDGGTGSDSGGAFIGPCLAPPPVTPDPTPNDIVGLAPASEPARPSTRRAALERLLSRDILPADLVSRLRPSDDD